MRHAVTMCRTASWPPTAVPAFRTPVRRRLAGRTLRRHREVLGWTLDDAACVLECDRSKVSRIETGERGIRVKEFRELMDEYGVAEEQRAVLTLRHHRLWSAFLRLGPVLVSPPILPHHPGLA
jgi:transcriptional regulator with XRE-family HTH domain